jgi:hypothetical protein
MPTYKNAVGATANTFESLGKNVACAWNEVAIATGDLTLNTVIPLVRLPRGAVVHDLLISFTDMDTSGSPTLAFSVGDTGSTARFIAAVTATAAATARAGNSATSAATFAAHTAYTTETVISALVSTAAATAAAGTMKVAVFYTCE